jgi:SAM-dependent methyltransferase
MADSTDTRLRSEARFQDERMLRANQGEEEFRDRFYFINAAALADYEDLLSGLAGRRVVVVGSSDGGVIPLARDGVLVEGIDISAVSIEKLRAAIEKHGLTEYASARVMDAEALEYADGSIDAISCSGVLHHLDTERALRSWARSLKDDGFVALFEPLAFHPVAALFRLLTPSMRTPDEHPLRSRDFALMRKYFRSADIRYYGLTTVCCAAISIIPGTARLSRKLLPAFEAIDRALLKALPFLRHICWLTVARLASPVRSGQAPAGAGRTMA